ncbi:hypothetical protein [Microbacterium sp.]|uniref:hypothetical protein n=1 Tax=Microbacterium sp. TaxID=51671 RepID=UPI0039E56BEA
MPKSPLWENAEFLAACASDRPKNEIMEEWQVSSGLVVDVRKHLGATADTARSREHGESDEITDNGDGTRRFQFIRHRPVTLEDARELIRSSGDNPDAYNVSIRTISYGSDQSSNKISAWPKAGVALAETYPLTHLYAEAERYRKQYRSAAPVTGSARATVVCVADMQLGKVARRGGTADTLARLEAKRGKLDALYAERHPGRILIADLGDGIEGFESGGNPAFTNDLSLPDQLDAYSTEMFKFVAQAGGFADVSVAVVASNHAAWRRGKQVLGNPSDDFGIFTHKQVQKVAEAAGIRADWNYPAEYDESLRVDILGVPLGFVHGNQFAPGKAIDWWQAQAFGGQAVAHCDVMVHGHYHSFSAGVAGTNPFTNRERMVFGCPTLDNGSDWFRQTAGRDSEPGLLVFDVTADGLDLGSVSIL